MYTKFFKEYQDEVPEDEGSIGYSPFHDIVKLLMMRGKSKSELSTYYVKFRHGKNVFDDTFDIIGQMNLNESPSIDIISIIKSLNKEWHNHYELITWE